jgi:hypothetical protein
MKKIFIMIVLSLISQASFALPGDGKTIVKCHFHGQLKGSLMTSESNFQEVCFNHFKSPEDLEIERRAHPKKIFLSEDDLDPGCYLGSPIHGSDDPGI